LVDEDINLPGFLVDEDINHPEERRPRRSFMRGYVVKASFLTMKLADEDVNHPEIYMSERVFYKSPDSSFHLLLEIDEETITSINFCSAQVSSQPSTALEREIFRQFDLYFTGRGKEFDLPFFATGTVFQLMVWEEVLRIPYGKTISYKELAQRIDNPKASRAVGRALNQNPVPILIPCHRVIGSNGKLTGYGAGIAIKKKLLELERGNWQ